MSYIFFDIDNTLVSHVNDSHIPESTIKAVKLLKINGHVPAIATGRGYFLTRSVAEEFDIDFLVCSGGAQVFAEGKEIFTSWLPDYILEKFKVSAKNFPERSAAIDKKFLYTDGAFELARKYFNSQAGYDCVRPLAEIERALMCYIMIRPELIRPEHGIFFNPTEDIFLEKMRDFVEARPAGTSKWNGIKKLIEHMKADIDDVIAFGDGPNDVEMLKKAKIGIAVGKSSEGAKDAADFVADDIDEDGILKACIKLNLI